MGLDFQAQVDEFEKEEPLAFLALESGSHVPQCLKAKETEGRCGAWLSAQVGYFPSDL